MTIQEKTLNKLKEIINSTGLEAVEVPGWANTGTIMAMHDFDTVLTLSYQFNDGYASFNTGDGYNKEIRNFPYVKYVGTDLKGFITWFEKELKKLVPTVR